MRKLLTYRLLITLAIVGISYLKPVYGQTYPVQVSTWMTPPYSLDLSDYSQIDFDRLTVQIMLNDLSRTGYQVKLRLKIEGLGTGITLKTSASYQQLPIELDGGIPTILQGSELNDFFELRNLDVSGTSKTALQRNSKLPEGLYRFCFEIIDYRRNKVVSNLGCATAWLMLNDPPFLNLPKKEEIIKAQEPQNIIFQWTPRHTASPNASFATSYNLRLYEVYPVGRNPNDVVRTIQPLFETTVPNSMFVYGPAEPLLIPGRQYVYWVQAENDNGIDLFKNKGYSEVRSFYYGAPCSKPEEIETELVNAKKVKVSWNSTSEAHESFDLIYREELDDGTYGDWGEVSSSKTIHYLEDLSPNTNYQMQVVASCGIYESKFSELIEFSTPESKKESDFSCGQSVPSWALEFTEIENIIPGDVLIAADFDIEVKKIVKSGREYSGTGIINIPFLSNVETKVKFDKIRVNDEKRVIVGNIIVIGASIQLLPDELKDLLGESMDLLNDALDKTEEFLEDTENALDKIDNAIDAVNDISDQIEEFLPDDLKQELQNAKDALKKAKETEKNAKTDAEIDQAKTDLKEARDQLKESVKKGIDAYAKALKKGIRIILNAIKEIGKEKKEEFENAKIDLSELAIKVKEAEALNHEAVFGEKLKNGIEVDENTPLNISYSSNEELKENTGSEFEKASQNYFKASWLMIGLESLSNLSQSYDSEEKIVQLLEELKGEGKDLMKGMATDFKENLPEDQIKEKLKNELLIVMSSIAQEKEETE